MADDRYVSVRCVGGPLDDQTVAVRSQAGFLAVDRVNGRAYRYKRTASNSYEVCTDHDDSLVYPQGTTTGERAFDESRAWAAGKTSALDIVAVDQP